MLPAALPPATPTSVHMETRHVPQAQHMRAAPIPGLIRCPKQPTCSA
eukprot:CAMPEP_0202904160 /NCGR_PEP_ID=MMETSP1392-20130828/28158_1 /ASSEMBLY_ACC=CAM_ASM_000868 /TAXON_ID=225041 /ORGANISM="Chlamydomonas chlamydogama, Strain SAG 11-48b" /LENGTH=46 /DNA_ID= /DNA_START= /DNA_END= /DNA_ORIENTATION=